MDDKKRLLSKRTTATVTCLFVVALLAYSASIFGLLAPRALQEALTRTLKPESGPIIRIDKEGYVAGETVRIAGSGCRAVARCALTCVLAELFDIDRPGRRRSRARRVWRCPSRTLAARSLLRADAY